MWQLQKIRLFTPSVFVIFVFCKLQLFVCLVTFLKYSVKSLIFVISDLQSLSFFSLYSGSVLIDFLESQKLNERKTQRETPLLVFAHWLSSRTLLHCSFTSFQFLIAPAGTSSMMLNSIDERSLLILILILRGEILVFHY